MAIGTDSLIEFFGTQDTLGGTATASVADTNFSTIHATTGMNSWTNDDDAIMASTTLEVTYASAPAIGSSVTLYARLLNTVSTNDQNVPNDNFTHSYLGRFPLENVTSAQFITIDISLLNSKSSQEYEFYFQNNAGQAISAGWDFHITPKTFGPHA